MTNIVFHPQLSMLDALRIAHAQGARLVWRLGRVRMAPADPAALNSIAAMINIMDQALEHVAQQAHGGAFEVVLFARKFRDLRHEIDK